MKLSQILYSVVNHARHPLTAGEVFARAQAKSKKKIDYATVRSVLYRSTKISRRWKKIDGSERLVFSKLGNKYV